MAEPIKKGCSVPPSIEEWRDVVGYEGLYFVSNLGRVASTHKWKDGKDRRILTPINGVAYQYVHLSKNRVTASPRIHILVLTAFVSPRPDEMIGAHLDGDWTHNWLTNLAWCSQKENQKHSVFHGSRVMGTAVRSAKLTEDQVREIRRKKASGAGVIALAREYGVWKRTIELIVARLTWKHVA